MTTKLKITKTMGEHLVRALANGNREVVGARTNTERAMIGHGLVRHQELKTRVTDSHGHLVRSHGLVLTEQGEAEAKRLTGPTTTEERAAAVTREDVAEGVRLALNYLGFGERRREAEQAPASEVLEGEFQRIRRVMRRAMKHNGAEAAHQALKQYNHTEALLIAARRFEAEDAAQEAAQEGSKVEEQQEQGAPVTEQPADRMACGCTLEEVANKHRSGCGFNRRPGYNPWAPYMSRNSGPYRDPRPALAICSVHEGEHMGSAECRYPYIPARAAVNEPAEFRGLTRADVAEEAARALETLSAEDRATVEGHAPSVILGMAFRRAQTAYCADRRERTAEEEAAYDRCANIASAALIFERADDPEAAAAARADDFRITSAERAEEAKRREEAHARVMAAQWRGAQRHGKYLVRTEEVGHGLVRVWVRGPATEIESIERASVAYARGNGLRPGASAGGGEFFEGDYIAQRAYHRA